MQVPELAPADAELRAAESMWHGRYTRPRCYRADDLRVDAFGHSARHTRNAGVHGEDGLAALARDRTLGPRKDELIAVSREAREPAGATTLDAACHGHGVRRAAE